MPARTSLADYLDAIRYRRYSRSVIHERRRLLAYAIFCGDDEWLCNAPLETVLSTVGAQFQVRTRSARQKLATVVEDYRDWRRQQEGGNGD